MKHSVPIVAGISRGWRWLLVGKQSLGSGSLGSLRLSSFSFIYLNVALPLPLAAGDEKKIRSSLAPRGFPAAGRGRVGRSSADLGRFSLCIRERRQEGAAEEVRVAAIGRNKVMGLEFSEATPPLSPT